MSRIGKAPIEIPKGVEIKIDGQIIKVKGPKGALERTLHPTVKATAEGGTLSVAMVNPDNKSETKYHGLSRTLVANMVTGCSTGFKKTLSLVGVGYRAAADGKGLKMTLGFSHPVNIPAVDGIDFKVEKNTTIHISGASKEVVGQIAANIRSLRPPEPYHGKGVRYIDERIVTKVGKASGKK